MKHPIDQDQNLRRKVLSSCLPWENKSNKKVAEAMPGYFIYPMSCFTEDIVMHSCFSSSGPRTDQPRTQYLQKNQSNGFFIKNYQWNIERLHSMHWIISYKHHIFFIICLHSAPYKHHISFIICLNSAPAHARILNFSFHIKLEFV